MGRSIICPAFFLLLVSVFIGCSKNAAAPARVSGSLAYNGQPIKAGVMQFHAPDGTKYNAQISTDGTYTATDLPVGEMIITVETESINPGPMEKSREAQRRRGSMQQAPAGVETPKDHYIKIPTKYSNPKTSPLSVTLERGRQVQNFDLTD